jgi:hypothetical protein
MEASAVTARSEVGSKDRRHCEERSDEAIQESWAPYVPMDCFAHARNDASGQSA